VTLLAVLLAWAYVVLRVAHAYIHLGANRLRQRIPVYFASWGTLLALWITIALRGGPGFLHRALSGFLPDSGHDLCPRIRRDHEEESTPEPLAGLQS